MNLFGSDNHMFRKAFRIRAFRTAFRNAFHGLLPNLIAQQEYPQHDVQPSEAKKIHHSNNRSAEEVRPITNTRTFAAEDVKTSERHMEGCVCYTQHAAPHP